MLEKPAHKESAPAAVSHAGAPGATVERPNFDEPRVTISTTSENAARPAPETNTVIGSDVIFSGELVAGSNVYIHGVLEGTISRDTKNVVVGEQGRVKANVHAKSIRILGQVDGDIYGEKIVELMSGARVNGNIFCATVRLEKGAVFNGTVTMV